MFAGLVSLATPAIGAQEAVIAGHHVRWPAQSVCLDVPSDFSYLGEHAFTLPQSAGQRFIFAQVANYSMTRIVIVQAEHMTSENDQYRYQLSPGISAGPLHFKVNVFTSSNALTAREQPRSEAVATVRFLEGRGFHMLDQWVATRYATYDTAGRREFLVFYMEPADQSLDLMMVGPSDLSAFAKAFQQIRERADAIIRFTTCSS